VANVWQVRDPGVATRDASRGAIHSLRSTLGRVLRLLGLPVSDDDARSLVDTLLVEGTPDALSAAAMITKGVTAVGSSG